MSGLTSINIFILQAEGFLKVPTVQDGQCTDVLFYYYNDVLCSSKFGNEYCKQPMLNFFEPEEEIPGDQQE